MLRWLRLARTIDRINEWTGRITAWLVLVMVLLGSYNAVVRHLGRSIGVTLSSNAYIELQWYLFSLVFLLGAAYTLKHNAHVRVDVLYGNLKPRQRAWINLAGTSLFLLPFTLLMLYLALPAVKNSWAVREISPDPGGLKMAHAYSNLLKAGLAIVAKRRISATEVESMHLVGEVSGRNVVIVDDMTSTAGTLSEAARMVRSEGALRILAAVSHAILTEEGVERLRRSEIDELVTTDTTPVQAPDGVSMTVLTVASLLAEAIQRIHGAESVSSLFDIPLQ